MFLTKDVIEFSFTFKSLIFLDFILVHSVKYGCDLVIYFLNNYFPQYPLSLLLGVELWPPRKRC